MAGAGTAVEAVRRALTAERLRVVASLVRLTGDWELAEDCVQDAAERALMRWPDDGIPDNPAAWLTTTARRRAVDVLRRRRTEHDKLHRLHAEVELAGDRAVEGELYDDDRLGLLFACCHPSLPLAGRVALTLKTVTGLSTREVARAFLVSEATMGQRLLRTRQKIAHTGISLRQPAPHRLAERTAGILAVIYLLFNEGYTATEGEQTLREDVAGEAVRLAGLVAELLPGDGEVHGLRALLLLQHARRAARVDSAGDLVTLEQQDRTRWDRGDIAAGLHSLCRARGIEQPAGCYQLQAEIAAVHATAQVASATDWARIVTGYDALLAVHPTPVVALNRAVAVGFRDGAEAGLAALAEAVAAGGLDGYSLVSAVRADLQRRAGRPSAAAAEYRMAIQRAGTGPERRLLQRRLDQLTEDRPEQPAVAHGNWVAGPDVPQV